MGGERLRCRQREVEESIARAEWFSNAELYGVHRELTEAFGSLLICVDAQHWELLLA